MLWLADLDGAISGKGPVRSIKKGLRSLKTLFIRRLQVLYLRGPPLLPPLFILCLWIAAVWTDVPLPPGTRARMRVS